MPLRHSQNQYRGVNAHFQSFCQAENDWESFHGQFIATLVNQLNPLLPSGYRLRPERSLQIREFHPDTGETILGRPKPDLSIFDKTAALSTHPFQFAPAPSLVLPLQETLPSDPAAYLRTLTIYHVLPDVVYGQPITQIEILSPTNKPPHSGYLQYVYKRDKLLHSGMNLVEVDLLHETASPLENVPVYPDQVPHATPYYVAISTTDPSFEAGEAALYSFEVDQPIPVLHLPLKGSDYVPVDFEAAYNTTFESLLSAELVDYEQLPLNFQRYSSADQERIRAVMERVKTALA